MKLVSISLWCDCEDLTELKLVDEDYHGEVKKFKCPKCGREIKAELSLVSGEIDI